jgi:molybdopterin-guanine dinucleotide biosynthesis protein A
MHQDKAWLDWQGLPLWRHQLATLAALSPARLFISCREEQLLTPLTPAVEPLYDDPELSGPLPALLRCLASASLPLLVLAVDMPAITPGFLLSWLSEGLANPGCGLVFTGDHGFEPLCALYPPEILPLLQDAVATGNFRLQALLTTAVEAGIMLPVQPAPHALPHFLNLNRPSDLSQV